MPTVSVIVVNWNSGDLLTRCLHSLSGIDAEVAVVDNASTDGSLERIEHRFPSVRIAPQASNLGFAGGVNAGARVTSGRYLLLLNTDAVVSPGAVATLAAFLDAHRACGAVTGKLVGEDGQPQRGWNVRRFPTVASFAVELLMIDRLWPTNPVSRRQRMLDLSYDRALAVEQPAAACLMVRREAFDALGGMDEDFYPAWFEDVDFCRRLRAAGWQVFLVPDAVVWHRGGVARHELGSRAFALAWYRNLERYVAKHHRAAARTAVKVLIVVGMAERIAASALRGDLEGMGVYAAVARQALRPPAEVRTAR